jgi:carboxylate-amine ligase
VQIPFTSSPRSSLGVEWELELVDLQTRGLSSAASEILAELGAPFGGEHPKAKHELLESCIEVITGVCTTVDEAVADLRGTVDEVAVAAGARDLGVMCSGTHPFTDWSTQQISPDPATASSSTTCSGRLAGCRSSVCTCTSGCVRPTRRSRSSTR